MSARNTTPNTVELPVNSVSVCTTAPVNIAVIKYWGKKDEELIIPINDSLSATIDQNTMKSCTQIIASKQFDKDEIWLNHKQESIEKNKRLQSVIQALRSRAQDYSDKQTNKVLIPANEWNQYKLHIYSVNNFPTAAGLASSAAGYACFTACLSKLYGVQGDLSSVARLGSGSACRSMYGGWVKWIGGGEIKDGSDSIAEQVVDETHWPEIRILILVANAAQKDTSSTDGMQRSVETSQLLAFRAKEIVPARMKLMEEYIRNRDFEGFGKLTIQDSNQFHATCLDTYPPIFYLNQTSKSVITAVHSINKYYNRIVAAYTFDAGPNAVIYCLEKDQELLINCFLQLYLPNNQTPNSFLHDPTNLSPQSQLSQHIFNSEYANIISDLPSVQSVADIKIHQLIVTRVGNGPQLLSNKHSFQSI